MIAEREDIENEFNLNSDIINSEVLDVIHKLHELNEELSHSVLRKYSPLMLF